jgi:hypothetical protein
MLHIQTDSSGKLWRFEKFIDSNQSGIIRAGISQDKKVFLAIAHSLLPIFPLICILDRGKISFSCQ